MFTLTLLYSLIVLVLLVGAFFIVYHIIRYSLTHTLGYFGAALFGAVFVFLLAINYFSFRGLDTETVLPGLEIAPLLETPSAGLKPKTNPW